MSSALSQKLRDLGLIGAGRTAKLLHITSAVLKNYSEHRALKAVRVDYDGGHTRGYDPQQIAALHDKMWPRCPWAAQGKCELTPPAE